MNRLGGPQRKTRHKLKKDTRDKGKINIKSYLQGFKVGERVQLYADSTFQKGRFPLQFYGKIGVVTEKQGKSYIVKIRDQNAKKSFVVHPVHLKKV